ncbi:MAG: hypothetical protein ACE5DI_04035 [Candidatus Micrarchaeia archaeon]
MLIWCLGSSQLKVFRMLCGLETARREYGKSLATGLGVSESVVSRSLKSLAEKKLVVVSRSGKRNQTVVSDAPHALALKAFLAASPHVSESVLAHSNIRVLSGLLFPNASVARVKRLGFLPEITVRRVLCKLLDAGVVGRRSPTDYYILLPGLKKAVGEYVSFAVMQSGQDVPGSLVVRGPFGFLRTTSAERASSLMKPTGLSVLNKFGVEIVQTDFKDYYYNVFGTVKKPGLEKAVVHALLRSTALPSAREASYALLALYKNRGNVDKEKFLAIAGDLGVESIARQALVFVKAFAGGRKAPAWLEEDFQTAEGLFPVVEDFRELVTQYG